MAILGTDPHDILGKMGGSKMSFLEKYLQKASPETRNSGVIAYLAAIDHIRHEHPLIAQKIVDELHDQRKHLKLIASENFSSLVVQLAMGNLLTDKYAEGYPERRFYAGCENIDVIESNAIQELKNIFGCEHAYVQPHSGADANLLAYWAILLQRVQNRELEKIGEKSIDALSPEDYEKIRQAMVNQKIMGLSLNSGGHLTHGYRHNVSSKFFKSVMYDVDKVTQLIDYKALQKQVKEERPLILVVGYSAYPRKINFAVMREIANEVGAVLMVDMAHFAGLVAGKVFQGEYNPIPYADIVTSTTHKTLRGPRGGLVLCKQEFKEAVDKGCPLVLGGPLPHVIAAKAIAFKEAGSVGFQNYAHQIVKNAHALADGLMSMGAKLTTNGTDNHLLVMDVMKSFGLNGRQAETLLRQAFFTVNRNTVPFDENGAWYTSGVRIGTPAITTLGMKEQEMKEIARLIFMLLNNARVPSGLEGLEKKKAVATVDPSVLIEVQNGVKDILKHFPLYPEIEI